MQKVNQNFIKMVDDFNGQRWAIKSLGKAMDEWKKEQQEYCQRLSLSFDDLHWMVNMLSNRVSEEMALGVQLCQDVSLLMAWSKEMEDGTTTILSECLQKLEDQWPAYSQGTCRTRREEQ